MPNSKEEERKKKKTTYLEEKIRSKDVSQIDTGHIYEMKMVFKCSGDE